MTGSRVRATLAATVSACLLLVACSDSAPGPGEGKTASAAPKPSGPKLATAGAQMVAAVSAGKTATAVGVHFALGNSPKVATALPVEIAVIPHEPFTSLRAHFESQDGLTLISGEDLEPRADVKAETTIQHQLVLMPNRDGVFMVTVNVDTEGKEGIVSRIFSIPVIVAPVVAPEAPPAPPADASAPAGS